MKKKKEKKEMNNLGPYIFDTPNLELFCKVFFFFGSDKLVFPLK
jgi:hypothetical protein